MTLLGAAFLPRWTVCVTMIKVWNMLCEETLPQFQDLGAQEMVTGTSVTGEENARTWRAELRVPMGIPARQRRAFPHLPALAEATHRYVVKQIAGWTSEKGTLT